MIDAVVGFSGGIASGKSSLSTAVAQALGWPRTTFGGYVRQVTELRGLEPNRDNWQKVGEALIQQDAADFCRNVVAMANWEPRQPLIIDGIRHLIIADILDAMFEPSRFLLVHVDLPRDERELRLKARDGESELLGRFEQHSTEVQVDDLRSRANLVCDGDLPVEQLVDEVVRYLQTH